MPFRSPIFRKLLLGAFLPIALALAGLDFYLTRYTVQRQREAVAHQLEGEAKILAGEIEAAAPADLAAWARAAARRAGARVTLVDPRGVVLADSQGDIGSMDNHRGRPEVAAALRGQTGVATRRSATLDVDLSYVAVPLTLGGQAGRALRLALPLRDVNASIAAVRWRILAATVAAAFAALLLSYLFSRWFTRRVRRLQTFAESLLAARSPQSLPSDASDELGDLARSLTRASAQLRELFEQLSVESRRREAILSSMVEGVLAVDHQLHVTFCNEAFACAVGARSPVPVNAPALDLVRDPAFLELLGRVIDSGETLKLRLELAAAEGRAFEVQAAPLAGAGAHRGAIAILHDITDRERLERVRKDFVANVSHELRTPLTAIRGYAETLLDGALEDQENNRKFLEIIRAHAIRLNNIASDLLALSELESGSGAAEPERVPVREALDAALRTVEAEARLREVALKPGPVEDCCVLGRRIRLEQALVNLLGNAVKFNRPGGEVRIAVRRGAGNAVRIEIADTGAGIPSEDLPRIFERFYRVDKARSREVGGTGLGLSIVKHAVERMNGTIAVASELGKGSVFTLSLPAC